MELDGTFNNVVVFVNERRNRNLMQGMCLKFFSIHLNSTKNIRLELEFGN